MARQLQGAASKDVAPRCAPTGGGAEAVVGADLAATAFRPGPQGGAPAPGHGLKDVPQVRAPRPLWERTWPRRLFAPVPKVARQLQGTASEDVAPRCAPTGAGSEAVVGADLAATALRCGPQGGAPASGHGLRRCRAQVRSHRCGLRSRCRSGPGRDSFSPRSPRWRGSAGLRPQRCPTGAGSEAFVGADLAATALRPGPQGGAPASGHRLRSCRGQIRSHKGGCRHPRKVTGKVRGTHCVETI
ncbi:hypothetical protein SAMN02800692_0743 [Luteibacter sp. UNC138MFCol5.1]|nr:hypothetical protein SAMN02800692_0743 [Luteibacter sp. UNC138MFCol5.1]